MYGITRLCGCRGAFRGKEGRGEYWGGEGEEVEGDEEEFVECTDGE